MKSGRGDRERRKAPRGACRLACSILRGRERLRARVLDVSEGGLCLLSPVRLEVKRRFEIAIDVPGAGQSRVRVEIWHVRRQKSRGSGHRVWIAGALLVDADSAYQNLLRAAGVLAKVESGESALEEPPTKPTPPKGPRGMASKPSSPGARDAREEVSTAAARSEGAEPGVFRIRCKATGEPRSRVLTLAAESRAEAESAAMRDLGDDWSILEIREVL